MQKGIGMFRLAFRLLREALRTCSNVDPTERTGQKRTYPCYNLHSPDFVSRHLVNSAISSTGESCILMNALKVH